MKPISYNLLNMACISLKGNDFYLLEYFHATVNGRIESVRSPRSCVIEADEIGEILHDADVMESKCEIKIR